MLGTCGNVVRTVGPSVFIVVLSHVALAEVLLKFLTSVDGSAASFAALSSRVINFPS